MGTRSNSKVGDVPTVETECEPGSRCPREVMCTDLEYGIRDREELGPALIIVSLLLYAFEIALVVFQPPIVENASTSQVSRMLQV